MAQQTRFRRQGSLTINGAAAFGSKLIQPLGRGYVYRELVLRLAGTITWAAAASNAAATMNRGDEWGLIDRVDVVVNGSDTIRTFTGFQLWMLNKVLYGGVGRASPQMGDGATAAPYFDSTLIIPFWQPRAFKPMDTALDSGKLADFRVEVTVSAANGVNSAASATNVNATLDIGSYESFGIKAEYSECRMWQIQNVVGGATTELQIPLPVTSLYRGMLVNFAASAAGTAADIAPYSAVGAATGLTNLKLVSGTNVFRDINARMLKDWDQQRQGWPRQLIQNVAATAPITGGFTNLRRNTNLNEDSWLWFDLAQDGYLAEGIDSVGFSELNLIANVAAAGTVTVIPVAIWPRRGK